MFRSRWALIIGLSISGPLLFAPSVEAGVPSIAAFLKKSNEPLSLRNQATRAERDGRWDDALDLYLRLYNSANPSTDIRERIRVCLQNTTRLHRHRDPAFQQFVLALKP